MLFVQETAKSRAELLVKTLDDKDQGKMPVMLIYGEKDVVLTLFYSKIIVHILHIVLYTFPKLLTRRIWLIIKSLFSW